MTFNQRWTNLVLLFAGALLLALSQVRWGVNLLGWFAPVPFIVYLHRTRGWRSRMLLLAAMALAWGMATAKYITDPFPKMLILTNGLSYAIISFAGFALWDSLRHRLSPWQSNLCFASVFVSIEWAQYMFTPMATNGSIAYTQLDNLPFLQLASLFGLPGISFVIYWFAAIAAQAFIQKRVPLYQTVIILSIITTTHLYGAIRVGTPFREKTVRMATVGTGFDWFGGEVPSSRFRQKINGQLFDNTLAAAAAGAKLVAWNEVSTIVLKEEEKNFLSQASAIASQNSIHLVVAYLKPIALSPFLVENKYIWIGPDGRVLDSYLKQKTLPVEPSKPGDGHFNIINTKFGKATGAICYDYDFPHIALARGKKDADLVVVPASDLLGLDPVHTQMAAMRAIEGGYSILRATRMGLSAGIDQFGRIRGWLSDNETDTRVMLVELPVGRQWTLYSAIGDVIAYLSLLFILLALGIRIRIARR